LVAQDGCSANWIGGISDLELVAVGHDHAYVREDGRPLRPEYATRHFQALAEQAGLPVIRLHDLRHTNASLALSAGVDMKVVSERLGHSQMSITADLYTHVNRGLGKAAAEQIARALKPTGDAVSCSIPAAEPRKMPHRRVVIPVTSPEKARPPPHLRRSGA
jgi:hypothetical protein